MATVVIIGSGIGGLSTAIALRKKITEKHRVIVIERETTQYFQPSLVLIPIGRRNPEDITRKIDSICSRDVCLKQGEAINIDFDRREVETTKGERLQYDFLVLSPGVELAPGTIPGLDLISRPMAKPGAAVGFDICTMEGAIGLRGALATFESGNLAILTPPEPYKCPLVPYEVALLIDHHLRKTGRRKNINITIYSAEAAPFEVAGPESGAAIMRNLNARRIEFIGGRHILEVDPPRRILKFREGIETFDLLIYMTPVQAPKIARNAKLLGKGGFIEVDPHSLETGHDEVYALGDAIEIPLPSGGYLPKMGAAAHLQSLVVAANIAKKLEGKGRPRSFSGVTPCIIETGGLSAFITIGSLYKAKPRSITLPRLPLLATTKELIERNWLRERQ